MPRGLPSGASWTAATRSSRRRTEIDEVVARERFAVQVRVHQPQRRETPLGGAQAPDVREDQLGRVAHDDVVDLARAVDERAHLPARLPRRLAERAQELGRRHPLERDLAPVNVLEGLDRARRRVLSYSRRFPACSLLT